MLLLLLLGVGALVVFVTGLNRAARQLERDRITNEALAQAKEALIGRAVSDANHPGSFPCPDLVTDIPNNVPNDGIADLLAGNHCPSPVGRLPWKTLRLPDLRDGSGERLWYALSSGFRDDDSAPINSDTVGSLNVTGSSPATQAIAVIISPGAALAWQVRGASNQNKLENYLEKANAGATTDFVAEGATTLFNDRLMAILHGDLFPKLENRIAREAKKCLDDYALVSGGTYPWAAKLDGTATLDYVGDVGQGFGRFPQAPNNGVSTAWTPDCADDFMNRYWGHWKALIFYQVSPGYQPGGNASCPVCLTLNGRGSYRAMIIMAGRKLSGQKRAGEAGFSDVLANYLEDGNADGNYAFDRKSPSASFNDQIACVDGKTTCK